MRKISNIGIVLETKADAVKMGLPLEQLYHWREPEEIEAISTAIKNLGFRSVILGTPEQFVATYSEHNIDFILNLSVGFSSRFRLAAGPMLYSLLKIPYSGADPYTKMLSQHKHIMKALWDKLGIPTPEWTYIHSVRDLDIADVPAFPLVLKPAYEGSSIGIDASSVVRTKREFLKKAKELFGRLNMPLLAERFIAGRELKVGLIGNGKLSFSGIIEDVRSDGCPIGEEILYFKAKTVGVYSKKALSAKGPLMSRILRDSCRIYGLFLPVDFGTMDLRIDEAGQHYFLEFNADATLHPRRTLAQCCALHGISYEEMLRSILATSFKRWNLR